jgi:chromosome segregation ATPase
MDDWTLERDSNKLSEALSDLYDHAETVSKLVEAIETLEKERDKYVDMTTKLEDELVTVNGQFLEVTERLAETVKENITYLQTIQSLQT